ncbi:CDP-alcohol phosphatidyltransferase family protein [Clostridium sp. CS001]|uniref:CDP-alcohol phosphatidyltransferase family protein n=1 Tax=Clostridium sp. CS001 TaxID=2880648 RepID=UPI001CF2B519|nr:CDP-alcohol phosphatidyltransferase family protein [Clostridium sp. CS001]MCB2289933.1 CDP-alcohol phosphatidyltransferase family protein [Clostridium sp. CS001]
MLDTNGRKYFDKLFQIGANVFLKIGLKPTHITLMAAFVGIMGSVVFLYNQVILSIILLWLSGYLDAVDGAMARKSGQTSAIGTLLDIWLDRLVEIVYIIAFAIKCSDATFSLMILSCAIILSMTVFLTSGTLIENKGIKSFHYQAGLMERTEGFIMFTIMMAFSNYMRILAFVYALLILYTAIQRLFMTIKFLGGNNEE